MLNGEEAVGLFDFGHTAGRVLLSVEGVGGVHGPLQGERVVQAGQFGDFVGIFIHGSLPPLLLPGARWR